VLSSRRSFYQSRKAAEKSRDLEALVPAFAGMTNRVISMAKNLMVLYGINSILERLKCDPSSIRKIFIDESFTHPEIEGLITQHNIRFEIVSARDLKRITPAKDLQKIVAKVERFEYVLFDDLLKQQPNLSLVFLDGISDPHNVGVILRTLACYGGFALILPAHNACNINDTVMHVASGGENYVPVAEVSNLKDALAEARTCGIATYGSVAAGKASDITAFTFTFPLAIVLGSEARGISKDVLAEIDHKIMIPMDGAPISFNVNNACAIMCYEVAKQRKASLS
jgi:23S rRNA (guanosine2251-2'-O)-methyltransferase